MPQRSVVGACRRGARDVVVAAAENKLQPHTNAQRFFVAGQAVELWEDPQLPFGCGFTELEAYCLNSRWDLLFNAIVLACLAHQDEDDEAPRRSPRCAWAYAATEPAIEGSIGH